MFRFEKLSVSQRAIEHASGIYDITRSFPDDEQFGLTSQMRRAAVSISSNIAEGTGRRSDIEFARFVENWIQLDDGSCLSGNHCEALGIHGRLSVPADLQ